MIDTGKGIIIAVNVTATSVKIDIKNYHCDIVNYEITVVSSTIRYNKTWLIPNQEKQTSIIINQLGKYVLIIEKL